MILWSAVCVFELSCLLGCGSRPESPAHNGALPVSWYKAPEGAAQKPAVPLEKPSLEMDESIRAQFAAHTAALSDILDRPVPPPDLNHPADWVAWHLDGMIASFAVDAGGIFGALVSDGTVTVRGTWQQPAATAPSISAKKAVSAKKNGFKFRSSMNVSDVTRMLEPAVRTAVLTKAVQNEGELRKNLVHQGAQFLAFSKVLDGLHARRGWHVDSLQLQLTFDAQGKVTPAVNAGGQLNIFFDWEKASDAEAKGAVREGELFQNVAAFAETMGQLIPDALADSKEIRAAGFTLDQFQVGMALIAGVKLGIAQVQSTVQGKIIFKTNTQSSLLASSELMSVSGGQKVAVPKFSGFIPFATTDPDDIQGQFADTVRGRDDSRIVQVPENAFREGLGRAIHMGTYFIQRAQEVDTNRWKITQIETEFDASLGGDFRLATLAGQGQFLLDFHRITQ